MVAVAVGSSGCGCGCFLLLVDYGVARVFMSMGSGGEGAPLFSFVHNPKQHKETRSFWFFVTGLAEASTGL